MQFRRALSARPIKRLVTMLAATATVAAGSLAVTAAPAHAGPIVGYACAYYTNVGFFGGAPSVRGCGQTIPPGDAGSASPSVSLPPGGSSSTISQTDYDGAKAVYGPAVIFGGHWQPDDTVPPSGQLLTSTQGTTTVVSTAQAYTVGPSPFYANYVLSRCTATGPSKTYTVSISGGVVETSTDANGNPLTWVNVPSSPTPGYSVAFTLNHIGDHGVVVFNERINNADGSVTLNAVHMYLQGPTAVGDYIVGQTTCGS